MFWNAIQAFIDPNTKSKCKFDEAIKDEVPLSQLSSEFGGELDSTYNHDLYWPELVKLSTERRKEMLRRFKEDCNSEIGASEWVIRGGDDETSPFNRGRRGAPSEMTTTSKSSEMGTFDSYSGEKAREGAVLASMNRNGEATTSPIHEEPDQMAPLTPMTPMEKFQTPSSFLNSSPLDRVFSAHNSGVSPVEKGEGGEATLTAQAGVLAESSKRTSTESEGRSKASKRHDRESSGASATWHHFEEEMSKGFKDFNHKLHGAFTNSGSRRSSQERKPKKDKSGDDVVKEKRKSKLRDSAVEADRKENVESQDGMTRAKKVTSAQEVAAVAGAVGITGAAGAIGGATVEGVSGHASTETTLQGDQIAEKKEMTNGVASNGDTKTIHVLYFAAAKEAVGSGKQDVQLPEMPFALSKLGEYLAEEIRKSGKGDAKAFQSVLEKSRWSVNEDMIEEEEVGKLMLQGGEDVAIIPPVSGG